MHFFLFKDISPDQNYAQCYWRPEDVDALYAEGRAAGLPSSGTPRLAPVEDKPWGMREFAFSDPNGNLAWVGHKNLRHGSNGKPLPHLPLICSLLSRLFIMPPVNSDVMQLLSSMKQTCNLAITCLLVMTVVAIFAEA
jgi:hypothetical protein